MGQVVVLLDPLLDPLVNQGSMAFLSEIFSVSD